MALLSNDSGSNGIAEKLFLPASRQQYMHASSMSLERQPLGSCFHIHFSVSNLLVFGHLQDIFFIKHSRNTGIAPFVHYIWWVLRPVLLFAQGKPNYCAVPPCCTEVTRWSYWVSFSAPDCSSLLAYFLLWLPICCPPSMKRVKRKIINSDAFPECLINDCVCIKESTVTILQRHCSFLYHFGGSLGGVSDLCSEHWNG